MTPFTSTCEPALPRKMIERQLEKIFHDPLFAESDILKRFLSFILNETLDGRSNCLKEYTIAVNVLDKPVSFKPQENGIVRIHAGRLRRALDNYYQEKGADDDIQIYIPKGKYVPFIADRKNPEFDSYMKKKVTEAESIPLHESSVIAVVPFLCLNNNQTMHSFTDGLCLQITEELMHMPDVSVVCYQAVRSLAQKVTDFKEIASTLSSNYLIAGSTQFLKGDLRICVQIIKTSNCMQIWSRLYERKLTRTNAFELEDEISALVASEFQGLPQFVKKENLRPLSMAVN